MYILVVFVSGTMAFLFLLPEQWLNDEKEVFVYCDLCMLRFLCMAAKVLCIVICVWQLRFCVL